jgi:hypothetical protein
MKFSWLKHPFTILLLLAGSGIVKAQSNALVYPDYQLLTLVELPQKNADTYHATRLENFFKQGPNYSLKEEYNITSPYANHITFGQYYKGKKILFSGVKLHLKKDGSVIIQSYLSKPNKVSFNDQLDYIIPTMQGLVSVQKFEKTHHLYPTYEYKDQNGLVYFEINRYKYFKDTTAKAQIFEVNPINTANTSYGGSYIDNSDQTNSSLDSQLRWVDLQLKFEDDSFRLESQYAFLMEISFPFEDTYDQPSDTFSFTRDQQGFEAVNAYYHINQMAQYTVDMGYGILTDTIGVDVHAFGGADNSAYDPNNHTLQFGEGGIDDAEDGEVVIHEYVHSLSELASPDNTIGSERGAMEEGHCDYMSKAYSRTFNDNTPNKVFSWDGFNPFFSGININTNKKYPNDLTQNKNEDRNIWSSVLMCVHDYIGRLPTDSLVLEHFFYQGPNTTMAQMAKILLTIDSSDFDKRYYSPLKQCLVDGNFVPRGSISKPLPPKNYTPINSRGFAEGSGNLQLNFNGMATWQMHNALGQIVGHGSEVNQLELNPMDFTKGIYILQFTIDNQDYSFKIVR